MDYQTELQVKNLVKDLYYQEEYAGDILLIADEIEQELDLNLDEDERLELELLVEDTIEEVQDSESFDDADDEGEEEDDDY